MNERGKDDVARVLAKDRTSADSSETEQFGRLAEDTREVRDHHREALETVREERERLRDTAEAARVASAHRLSRAPCPPRHGAPRRWRLVLPRWPRAPLRLRRGPQYRCWAFPVSMRSAP